MTTSSGGLAADLVARRSYGQAIGLLKVQLRARPRDASLRQQLADVLSAAGRASEAAPLLRELAEDLARRGLAAQAIAAAKRAEALDPGPGPLEERLAGLIEDHSAPAATPAMAELPLSDASVRDQLMAIVIDAIREDPSATAPEVLRTPLFEDFSREELIEVIRGLRLLAFEAGDIVVAEGEPGQSLFVVTTGRVKAFVRRADGRCAKVRELHEGDFFGEVSILQGGVRTATITCATRCDLLELDKPTLDAIAARHPNVPRVLQAFYGQRAGSTLEHMIRGIGGA